MFGVLLQYPTTDGRIDSYAKLTADVQAAGGKVVVATDLLALTLLTPPGEWGADVAVGSAQRFGVPLGFGGPHAAFLATADPHKRKMPGRVIGVSKDSRGKTALRMAMQVWCALRLLERRAEALIQLVFVFEWRADSRAAHSPRQSVFQHLHGAGAARKCQRFVRDLPRPGGTQRDRCARARRRQNLRRRTALDWC